MTGSEVAFNSPTHSTIIWINIVRTWTDLFRNKININFSFLIDSSGKVQETKLHSWSIMDCCCLIKSTLLWAFFIYCPSHAKIQLAERVCIWSHHYSVCVWPSPRPASLLNVALNEGEEKRRQPDNREIDIRWVEAILVGCTRPPPNNRVVVVAKLNKLRKKNYWICKWNG